MSSSITPTIGRKVWFWNSAMDANVVDENQAFDATVVFVHPDGKVALQVIAHNGQQQYHYKVDLKDPGEADRHGKQDSYATWMPYQVHSASKVGSGA